MNYDDVAVIGAGPYGLSVSAHLTARGLRVRTFGTPMESWRSKMPAGMFLKSEGFASNLYAPGGAFTLAEYCRLNAIPYADLGVPVSLETFVAYGEAFASALVPNLDPRKIRRIRTRIGGGYRLELEDETTHEAGHVIVAVGLTYAERVPEFLAELPPAYWAHSARHSSYAQFAGRDVTVIGGGASAVDCALALHAAGATVRILSRHELAFHSPPELGTRSLYQRLRYPWSGLGKNWKAYFYAEHPHLYYWLPRRTRVHVARTALGPAPGWFTRDAVAANVAVRSNVSCRSATLRDGRVHLEVEQTAGGGTSTHTTDFVLAATGYASDVTRVPFLVDLLPSIRLFEKTPVLSADFESSLSGLYFAGVTAADSFGPVLRFAFGARFTAERLARRLAAAARANSAPLRKSQTDSVLSAVFPTSR